MIGLVINIVKAIISLLLKVYKPNWLLRLDKYLEEKIGIDIIKQNFKELRFRTHDKRTIHIKGMNGLRYRIEEE